MEAAGYCEILVPVCQAVLHHCLEGHNFKVMYDTFLVHPGTVCQFQFTAISGTAFTMHVFSCLTSLPLLCTQTHIKYRVLFLGACHGLMFAGSDPRRSNRKSNFSEVC
jgi:hypothetical protein